MRCLLAALVLAALGCASPPNYTCTTPIDATGRGLPLCHDPMKTPVCDAPGDMARYEPDAMGGYVLQGGTTAICDASNQVVCADRTVVPHCIVEPLSP